MNSLNRAIETVNQGQTAQTQPTTLSKLLKTPLHIKQIKTIHTFPAVK